MALLKIDADPLAPAESNDASHLLRLLQARTLDAVPQGIAIVDLAGRIVWVNRTYAAWRGVESAAAIGSELPALCRDRLAAESCRVALDRARGGMPWSGEVRDVDAAGAPCWLDLTVAPVHGDNGAVAALFCVHQDAGWRRSAQADIERERSLLHALMDSIPDTMYCKDRAGRFTLINRAQARMLGIDDPRDAVGKTDFDFLAPEFAAQAWKDEQRILASGLPLVSKSERVVRRGFARWVTATKVPLRNPEGDIIGLVGLSRDVTAFKQTHEALRRSEEFFRLLFEAIPNPVWVCQAGTRRILRVNRAALRLYGYTEQEFRRMRVCDLEVQDGAGRDGAEDKTLRHRTAGGRIIDVQLTEHPYELRYHKALLVIVEDVSRRKRLELELRQAQRLEAVGGLAAGIAHEINTPIQYISDNLHFLRGACQSIQRALAAWEEFRRTGDEENLDRALAATDLDYLKGEIGPCVEQSLEGAERVAGIVRAMKEFAHPGHSDKQPADLNHALSNALIVTRNQLKYVADVETVFAALPLVPCYLAELNQVFLNLLVNAADAIAERAKNGGPERGLITVRTARQGEQAVITVTDTGCGIPREIQARVFEPFFTTKEVGRGSGQGLAIARSIVTDKHGGTLSFTSTPGQGTTFTITLPLAERRQGGSQ